MAKKLKLRPKNWWVKDWKIPKDAKIQVDAQGRIGFVSPTGHSCYHGERFVFPVIHAQSASLQEARELRPATEKEEKLFRQLMRRGRARTVAWHRGEDRKAKEKEKLAIERHAKILDLVGLRREHFYHSGVRSTGVKKDKSRRIWGWYIYVETDEGYEEFSPKAVKESYGCFITRSCHDGEAIYYFAIPAGRIPEAKKLAKGLKQ